MTLAVSFIGLVTAEKLYLAPLCHHLVRTVEDIGFRHRAEIDPLTAPTKALNKAGPAIAAVRQLTKGVAVACQDPVKELYSSLLAEATTSVKDATQNENRETTQAKSSVAEDERTGYRTVSNDIESGDEVNDNDDGSSWCSAAHIGDE